MSSDDNMQGSCIPEVLDSDGSVSLFSLRHLCLQLIYSRNQQVISCLRIYGLQQARNICVKITALQQVYMQQATAVKQQESQT